jgi:hypothetical protein
VNLGEASENKIDFMTVAREMLGVEDKPLYTTEDIQTIRQRADQIMKRIKDRTIQLNELIAADEELMNVNEIAPVFDDPELANALLDEGTA